MNDIAAPFCLPAEAALHRAAVSPADPSDRVLLRRFLRGDEDAYAALVQRHARLVLGVCHGILDHTQDAEDSFQAVFLVLARKAASLQSHPSIAAWLHQTARRTSLKLRATTVRRRQIEKLAAEERNTAAGSDGEASRVASLRELSTILDEELARLPVRFREVILLRQVEDLGRDEVATRLGLTPAQVKDRLRRGRERLRSRLLSRGVTFSAAALATWLVSGAAQAAASTTLVATTAKAATAFACGNLSAGASSATVLSLTQGMLGMLGVQKLKIAVASVVSLLTAGVLVYGALQDDPQRFQTGLRGQVVAMSSSGATPTITISLEAFQTLLNFDVSPRVKVWAAFEAGELEDVRKGDYVSLRLGDDHRTVREIHIRGQLREALVKHVSPSGTITLVEDDDDPTAESEVFQLAPDAILRIGGLPATHADLKPGMEVPLEFSKTGVTVNAVEAEAPEGALIQGEIAEVDGSASRIKLRGEPEDGELSTGPLHFITTETLIVLDGMPATLADLKRGTTIILRLSDDGRTVRAVQAKSAPPED